ncbi:hypothetical protein [Hymenobacter koreensis]|uniref:Uncharacterized protein n=1 Tax=Hymenobacter koreensis TaxID=1084523 RepID=A0ABP8JLT3_9BACT
MLDFAYLRFDKRTPDEHDILFGLLSTYLAQMVRQADFQELWFAGPDTIEELKDSPLRYCTYFPHPLRRTANGYAVAA